MAVASNIDYKDIILKHSRQKFHREGFYKTSMDEIARELQISKKTIYKYFASKDKLLEEMCNFTTCEINAKVSDIIEGEDNVVVKFIKLLNYHSGFMMNISDKWLNDIKIHAPWVKKDIDKTRDSKINQVLVKLLEQGKKEGLIVNYPTPVIISVFSSAINGIMSPEFLINSKFSMASAFKYAYNILLGGILTQKGKETYLKEKYLLNKELNLTEHI